VTKVAIISTSINARPKAYHEWAAGGHLIVAGDMNTPLELKDFVRKLDGTYMDPHEQDRWAFSEVIGWRCIQRRNAALMRAVYDGYDYVLSVDDDNFPAPNAMQFVDGHVLELRGYPRGAGSVIGSPTNFLNPGTFCRPQFHARGVPYGLSTQPIVRTMPSKRIDQWGTVFTPPTVVVSQAQVLGDPDCDAIERMCYRPAVQAVVAEATIWPGTYAPFNSQATMWTREWAPVGAVLPGIGRYDDIFASFIFARLAREYNVTVHFGTPVVRQERNTHDGVKDLMQEIWGLRNTFTFCSLLDSAHISASMPLHVAYEELIIATSDVLPKQAVDFAKLWVKTWREVIK